MIDSNPLPLPPAQSVTGIRVFVNGPGGGNPVPLVADALGMTAAQMQHVAQQHGHESAFVLPASSEGVDWHFRFFVPRHEMEMCGHATVGALWALRQWGSWTTPTARVETLSGIVDALWDESRQKVWVSQPAVRIQPLSALYRQRVAEVLRVQPSLITVAMVNAATSRVKTLVELPSTDLLHGLQPDFSAIEAVCEAIGSTGLYPYALGAVHDTGSTVFARQFPKSSGYPEDAATGIAAAALWGSLVRFGTVPAGEAGHPAVCVVRQGDAMGCPSAIEVQARFGPADEVQGCWLSGRVKWSAL